jgi:acyl-CoA synthetase (AMP-forming)/AMP-acid ligase II
VIGAPRGLRPYDELHRGHQQLSDYAGLCNYSVAAIQSSNGRIVPQEVENAISEHGAVLECADVGVPDEERGELVRSVSS